MSEFARFGNVRDMLANENDSETQVFEITCPVCKYELEFSIAKEELKELESSANVIKKAINHDNDHAVVVHINKEGKVIRVYGYQCVRKEKEKEPVNAAPRSLEKAITVDFDPKEVDIKEVDTTGFQSFLSGVFNDMARSAKHEK